MPVRVTTHAVLPSTCSACLTRSVSFLTLRVSSAVENTRSANGIGIRGILGAGSDLAWHKGAWPEWGSGSGAPSAVAWNLLEDLEGLQARVESPSWRHETDMRSFYIDVRRRRRYCNQEPHR